MVSFTRLWEWRFKQHRQFINNIGEILQRGWKTPYARSSDLLPRVFRAGAPFFPYSAATQASVFENDGKNELEKGQSCIHAYITTCL